MLKPAARPFCNLTKSCRGFLAKGHLPCRHSARHCAAMVVASSYALAAGPPTFPRCIRSSPRRPLHPLLLPLLSLTFPRIGTLTEPAALRPGRRTSPSTPAARARIDAAISSSSPCRPSPCEESTREDLNNRQRPRLPCGRPSRRAPSRRRRPSSGLAVHALALLVSRPSSGTP